MGAETKIEWCDHTVSPWHGCSKVSAGCDNCYAATMSKRNPATLGIWGDEGTRVKSKSFIKRLEQWNKQAEAAGKSVTVFPSLCDPFEDRPELAEWRNEMFAAIDQLPFVTLILVTKRPENIRRMWQMNYASPADIAIWTRPNVWLLTSVENQEQADKRIPELLKCRDLCPVLGLSCEPLLGPVDLSRIQDGNALKKWSCRHEDHDVHRPNTRCHSWVGHQSALDWVIAGGESGPHARPMHPDWPRSLRDQCVAAGVPFFFKQWGEWADATSDDELIRKSPVDEIILTSGQIIGSGFTTKKESHGLVAPDWRERGAAWMSRVGKKAAGRLLDGVEWSQFPAS